MSQIERLEPYAKVIVKLLQADMDADDKHWKDLIDYEIQVQDYLNRIGVELIINKLDGYAFVRQMPIDDDGSTIGLVKRTKVGFEVSMVCVLLRELLEEFEVDPTKTLAKDLYITHAELKEHIELFFKEKSNRVKFLKELDRYINRVVDLGFLKIVEDTEKIDNRKYLIKRLIKSKITIDDLDNYKQKLNEYVESV